uniref:Uncharacterized protein n=3 Tax=Aegilops tauschii subsp. strangulata TaxID=200361 RepID=A0A452YSS6_AEGTS
MLDVASDETLTEHRPRTKPHKHRRITSPSSSPPAPMTSPSAPVLHRQILPRPLVPSCRVSPRTPASVAAQPSPSPRRIWRLPLLRSSLPPEGSPAELVAEDSKFVPLNAEDPMYGPPVSRRQLRVTRECYSTPPLHIHIASVAGEI